MTHVYKGKLHTALEAIAAAQGVPYGAVMAACRALKIKPITAQGSALTPPLSGRVAILPDLSASRVERYVAQRKAQPRPTSGQPITAPPPPSREVAEKVESEHQDARAGWSPC